MRRLTTQEIIEPNVEYIVPSGTELPDDVKWTLQFYAGVRVTNTQTGQTGTRYSIPQYLMREWLAKFESEVDG
jgi:hypothetical protein